MRYSGIQPQYFPRLHYFARILNADIFMVRDDAQFVRKHKYPGDRVDKSYQADTPIKTVAGRVFLSLPIKHLGLLSLSQTQLDNNLSWSHDQLKTLQFAYGKSINFSRLFPELSSLLARTYKSLAELNLTSILWGMSHILNSGKTNFSSLTIPHLEKLLSSQKKFRLRQICLASQSQILNANSHLTANQKILALCQEVGANEDYCGGTGVTAYVDHSLFTNSGIRITVQDWKCPPYKQLFQKKSSDFIPNLSIIDLLMNVSPADAVKILVS